MLNVSIPQKNFLVRHIKPWSKINKKELKAASLKFRNFLGTIRHLKHDLNKLENQTVNGLKDKEPINLGNIVVEGSEFIHIDALPRLDVCWKGDLNTFDHIIVASDKTFPQRIIKMLEIDPNKLFQDPK